MLLDHHPLLAASVGVATALTSTLVHAPQVVRVRRSGDPNGIAPIAIACGLVQYAAWNVYAWEGQAWVVLASNVVGTMLYVLLAAVAVRAGLRPDTSCWVAVAWVPVLGAAALIGYGAFGVALTVGSLLTLIPSVLHAWTAERISGLSATTWTLALVNGLLYWLLGATGSPFAVLAFGVVATLCSTLVLAAMLLRTRARVLSPLEPSQAFIAAA